MMMGVCLKLDLLLKLKYKALNFNQESRQDQPLGKAEE
jgi:hypothetical protein